MRVEDCIRLIFDGVTETSERVLFGVTETHSVVDAAVVRRTVNGRSVRLRSRRPEKVAISLSCSGDRVWTPHVDALDFGTPVELHSSIWLGASLFGVLRWPIASTSDGRPLLRVTSDEYGTQVREYRPVIQTVVVGWSVSGGSGDRDAGWTLSLEEV